jgi:hypothetical protein
VDAGSWAQMPGWGGIHPFLDSGTARFDDQSDILYYYILFDPKTFAQTLSDLKTNAVILDYYTMPWAAVLNSSPDWKLAYIGNDSQVYLRRKANEATDSQGRRFVDWEFNSRREYGLMVHRPVDAPDIVDKSPYAILRGLKLRPDVESIQILASSRDPKWVCDPQISYLRYWLDQLPDSLVQNALDSIVDRKNKCSYALRILFALRLGQNKLAGDIARDWKIGYLSGQYQDLRLLQAEALVADNDIPAARQIVESLWPQPRFSLRWAHLCHKIYANDPKSEPVNARQLVEMEDRSDWKTAIFNTLNQNILRISTPTP